MDNERQMFNEDKIKKTRKQTKIIEILEKERDLLQQDLNSNTDGPHARREVELEDDIKNIESELESSHKLLESEKDSLWELEGHIKKLEKELNSIRGSEVTEMRYKETIFKTQKDVVKLENRLDVANKRSGVVMAENSELRQLIDHMLQERALFNDMWQKMINQLNQGKKYIMDLVEQSTAAYDQREELCNKLQTLKDRGQADRMLHVQEMRELQRKLDHDAKLQHFLEIKGNKRVNTELEAREAFKKKQQQDNLENLLREYKETLDKIMIFSAEQDVDKLAIQFVKLEEENFALFNYVNELSSEVEMLNEVVQRLEDNIDEQKGLNESRENSQLETIESLESDLKENFKLAEISNNLKNNFESKLDQLQFGVEKIFRQIKCDDAPVLNLLGSQKRVSIHNVKLFIGIIERRANQIINCINYSAEQPSSRILAKKDRIPKFNVRESAKRKD